MNYVRISLLIAFALFALICVGYANSKHTPKPQAAASCSAPALTCANSRAAVLD